jgi:polyisoprenoid-binding protein YceI
MTHIDAQNAELLVFTEKEGLLSPIAHDLKLRVTAFSLDVDGAAGRLTGRVDASSLRVVCAMKAGAEDPRALSDKDKRDIEGNIRKDVLDAGRHPEISLEASSAPSGGRANIRLTVRGRSRDVSLAVRREGERMIAEGVLHQPDFGIKPYSAMLGTLKVKADVRVVASWPASLMG